MTLPAPVVRFLALIADALRRFGLPLPIEGNQLRLRTRLMFYNCAKSWRELGEPRIPVQQSIQDSFTWYRSRGDV